MKHALKALKDNESEKVLKNTGKAVIHLKLECEEHKLIFAVRNPGTETAQKGPKDEVVTMAVISSWDTLNIYNTSGNYGNAVADQLFERLVTRTHDGVIEPRLATEWQIADDNKSMTFKLAENALWHDGEKLTANDIVFTCKAIILMPNVVMNKHLAS